MSSLTLYAALICLWIGFAVGWKLGSRNMLRHAAQAIDWATWEGAKAGFTAREQAEANRQQAELQQAVYEQQVAEKASMQ